MATRARMGYGTLLEIGDLSAITQYAAIGEINSGPDTEESAERIDVTNHQSRGRNGRPIMEYIGGPIDLGELTFTVNYDPTDPTHNMATGLRGLMGETRKFRLSEPGNPRRELFEAFVMNVSNARPVKEVMTMDVTLARTGDITLEII